MQNMYFRKKASRTRCVSTQQAAGLGVWTHRTVVPVSSIEWWWLEWGANVCRNSRPAAGSQPDPLLGAAQHLTPTVRRPLVENPAWRPSLPEKTGLGVGLLLLSHLIASLCTLQGPHLFQRERASLFRPLPPEVLEVESPTQHAGSRDFPDARRGTCTEWLACLCPPSRREEGAVDPA